jgi:hypothetical protein
VTVDPYVVEWVCEHEIGHLPLGQGRVRGGF